MRKFRRNLLGWGEKARLRADNAELRGMLASANDLVNSAMGEIAKSRKRIFELEAEVAELASAAIKGSRLEQAIHCRPAMPASYARVEHLFEDGVTRTIVHLPSCEITFETAFELPPAPLPQSILASMARNVVKEYAEKLTERILFKLEEAQNAKS